VLALANLWFVLAMLVARRPRWRDLGGRAPWTQRYGLYLALAWVPLGIWLLWDFYRDAFFSGR
jgi:hypothetical protein